MPDIQTHTTFRISLELAPLWQWLCLLGVALVALAVGLAITRMRSSDPKRKGR